MEDDYSILSDADISGLIDETPVESIDEESIGEPAMGEEKTAAQKEAEFEYSARGKTIKEPISKILERASRGYDYAELVSAHKQQVDQFNSKFQTYVDIDKAAAEHPDWWQHVMNSYQTRDQFNNQQNPDLQSHSQQSLDQETALPPAVKQALSELQELKGWKAQLENERLQKQAAEADRALDEDVKAIHEQYKHVDFTTPDVDGKSLEYKVLEHMRDNKIASFKTAFRDFYHDHLIQMAAEQAKEKVAKDVKKNSRLGLLVKESAPGEVSSAKNFKNKSYEELAEEGLRELGLV